MRKVKQVILLLSFISAFISCTKDSAGNLKGDMIGYTYLYDDNRLRVVDNSGITVSIEGTSISTTTRKDGRWIISNLGIGTYSFIQSKPNYGTLKILGKQFIGGGQTYFGASSLYPIPKNNVYGVLDTTTYTLNSDLSGTIVVFGSFSSEVPVSRAYFRLFAGPNSDVSSDPSKNICTIVGSVPGDYNQFLLYLDTKFLNNFGINSGDSVYIIVYPDSYNSSAFIDLNTGRYFYPNLNPVASQILGQIVP